MPIISAVGLFCFDKFEDNQTRKCSTFFPNVIVNYVNLTLIQGEILQLPVAICIT